MLRLIASCFLLVASDMGYSDAFQIGSSGSAAVHSTRRITTTRTTTTSTTLSASTPTPPFRTCNNSQSLGVSSSSSSSFPRVLQQVDQYVKKGFATATLCGALTVLTTTTAVVSTALPHAANAYSANDYSSETVTSMIQELKDTAGNVDLTLKAYERLADIITEGTGVGGAVNYKGVRLERGYIADEDTTIYNPGLTLLTESEKERLLEAVIQARQIGTATPNSWNDDVELGFDFLRSNLDPLHMNELKGYLGIFPFFSAVVYLGVLAVQQLLPRNLFTIAYVAGVVVLFGPALALIAIGP